MEESQKEKFDEVFRDLAEDSMVAILVHPTPDPDCIGAAAGMSVLLKKKYGLTSKIFHYGEVSHPQNKCLKNVLHISLSDGSGFNPDEFAATVVLDTDLDSSGFKSDKLQSVDVRMDHHEMDGGNGAGFKDVRVIGSTCAIVWDYLQTFEIGLEEHNAEATAMAIGIKTDTWDFTRPDTSDLDVEAFSSLLSKVDKASLSRVIKYPLPKSLFVTEAKAFREMDHRNTILVSFIGDLTAHNRDFLPIIADRFSRIDGVSTVVIMGTISNTLAVSVRSDDARVDVHDLCVNTFGKGNAGGKDGSGGATFDLGPGFDLMADKEVRDRAKAEVAMQLKEKIFEALGEHKTEEE